MNNKSSSISHETENNKLTLFVAAIVKDEMTGLLEWIAFHRSIGVSGFFIADNNSTDGCRKLLDNLSRIGVVDVFDFPNQGDKKPQLAAYQEILRHAQEKTDLLAFIDADEFITPTTSEPIDIFLSERFSDSEVSGLALNWAIFGSAGHLFNEGNFVVSRFTQRAPIRFHANYNFKSIVRPKDVHHFYNPHQAKLTNGHYVDSRGNLLKLHPKHGYGVSADVCWDGLRVNHYAVKSFEEFITGKYKRGSAATFNRVKHKAYFNTHDRNDEHCDLAARLAPQVKAEMDRLQALMDALPDEAPPPAPAAQPDGLWQQGLQLARRLKPGKH